MTQIDCIKPNVGNKITNNFSQYVTNFCKDLDHKQEFINFLENQMISEENYLDISSCFNYYWENRLNPEFLSYNFSDFIDYLLKENGESVSIELGIFLDFEDELSLKIQKILELAENYNSNLNISIWGDYKEIEDSGFSKYEIDCIDNLKVLSFENFEEYFSV